MQVQLTILLKKEKKKEKKASVRELNKPKLLLLYSLALFIYKNGLV